MRPDREELAQNFWSRVQKGDGCWIWLGGIQSAGYGMFRFLGEHITAHRVAFRSENPNTNITGLDVCHHCDNRLCVRPDHLFLGTRKDNMTDMVKKGRSNYGERNPNAKLSNAQIAEILSDRRSNARIAADYGVDPASISRIRNRKAYVAP